MEKLINEIKDLEKELKGIKDPDIRNFGKELIKKKKRQLALLQPYYTK